jgi:hypothetical protein
MARIGPPRPTGAKSATSPLRPSVFGIIHHMASEPYNRLRPRPAMNLTVSVRSTADRYAAIHFSQVDRCHPLGFLSSEPFPSPGSRWRSFAILRNARSWGCSR